MAHHVQDTTVFERRLRPIYDSLEVGNNKKALQDIEKLLKKHPSLICARGLKALALLRLGRDEESSTLLEAITKDKPTDDSTLQVLTFCYKEMEQLDKICDLYIHAAKQNPGNEEVLAHLFMSYVRLDDFKSQQSVALQLYKSNQNNPYYFWAVMSAFLQAVRGPESHNTEKRKIYLGLAQAMVDKLIREDKLEAEQEVHLYVNILEEQSKFKEALEFLDGPVCEKVFPGAPVYIKINLMKKLGMWNEINSLLKVLLKEERDRWDYYKDFLTSCFELYKADDSDENISIMDTTHEYLCELIEAEKKKVRGPYLARLELHKRMREHNLNANGLLGDFTDLLTEYFRLFGDKSCCTQDICLFLNTMSVEERTNLASNLIIESKITSTSLPLNKESLQKHICSLQLSRICGTQINLEVEHLLALNNSLKLHYEHGFSTFGKNLLPTDMGPSDVYAVLAAHIMYNVALKEKSGNKLLEALCMLQYVLKNSPSNFHIKLLCLNIYHRLGCIVGAQNMYELLDTKNIQLDSMGYLHCSLLPLCGRFTAAKNTYDVTLRFFTSSYKERLEYIATGYKYGSFSKLREFMNFRDRLFNSIHYATISVEELLLEFVLLSGSVQQNINSFKLMSINPDNDRISWDNLSDNRDLSVVVSWDPINLVDNENNAKESFNQDIEILQIRSLLLRLVASFVDLIYLEKTKNSETVQLLQDTWEGVFQRVRLMSYKPMSDQFLVNIFPCNLHLILQMPYESFFNSLAKFIIDLHAGKLSSDIQFTVKDNVSCVAQILVNEINECNSSRNDLWCRREIQQKVAASSEILSLYSFVLSICHEKYQTSSNSTASKKNKKKDGKSNNTDENVECFLNDRQKLNIIVEQMRHLKINLQNCAQAIDVWKSTPLPADLSKCMSDLSLQDEVECSVMSDVQNAFKENHEEIINELRGLFKDKIRMINK